MGLTLTREVGQIIEIHTPQGVIGIMVASIKGNGARIDVSAPKEFAVHRKEIADAIRQQQKGKP